MSGLETLEVARSLSQSAEGNLIPLLLSPKLVDTAQDIARRPAIIGASSFAVPRHGGFVQSDRACLPAPAGKRARTPYFVTYLHHLEQPGNLDIEFNPLFGTQRSGNSYLAGSTELEYGVKAWWTSEFYLDGQSTFDDSAIFTKSV